MANLKEKIAIIGGGPAGLSAAMYLEKKGYNDYTVFEKTDHVGGKCFSPTYEMTPGSKDKRRWDLGAIMGCDSYFAVKECEEFGKTPHNDGPELIRAYKNDKGKEIDPFNPKKNFFKIPQLLKMKKQIKRLGELLETKYQGYDVCGHRGVAEGKYEGLSPKTAELKRISGVNPNLKDLLLPFKDFCELNNIELIQKVWIGPFTAFGYGYFDEIPAIYVLKYLDFHTAVEFINGRLWTWKGGTQSIWENLNKHLKNKARLNSDITKVVRKDKKVYITVNGKEEVYDKVIITAPLQYMSEYFDASKVEKDLFSKIHYEPYDVLVGRPVKGYAPEKSAYIFDNMVPERLGRLMIYYHRWPDAVEQPICAYSLRMHKTIKEVPYEKGKEMVLNDLKTIGVPFEDKLIEEHDWYYFPHVFTEEYQDGWYDKVEALQGKKSTYYAGEVMSFGDMEETCEYSRDIVERFF